MNCRSCLDTGHVCESHPDRAWGTSTFDPGCGCGAPGMPCPKCCSPIAEDGSTSIAVAFTPDHLR